MKAPHPGWFRLPRRGTVRYAPVPAERSRFGFLVEPVVFLANVVAALVLYPAWVTGRAVLRPSVEQIRERVGNARPLIFYTWHAYEPLVFVSLHLLTRSFMPIAIGHDGMASKSLQRAARWFGFDVWVYRRRSVLRPLQQIIDFVRAEQCNIVMAADAGGPYRQVKPTLPEIAAAVDALLVPVVVTGKGTLTARWPVQYRLPLPFCSLVLRLGFPLDGRTATAESCGRALAELEASATTDAAKR